MLDGLAGLGLLNIAGHAIAVALVVWMLDSAIFAPYWAKVPTQLKPLAVAGIYAVIVVASLYASCSGLDLNFGQTCQPEIDFAQQAADILWVVAGYSLSAKLMFELVKPSE